MGHYFLTFECSKIVNLHGLDTFKNKAVKGKSYKYSVQKSISIFFIYFFIISGQLQKALPIDLLTKFQELEQNEALKLANIQNLFT